MERELWMIMYHLTQKLDNPWGEWLYSTTEILAVYFWAVLHDRPVIWALDPDHWPEDLRPTWFPAQSTISRRLSRPRTVELMTLVEEHLSALIAVEGWVVQIIDGKPLAVSNVSKDSDAGYGRGAGGNQKGYKLHAVWGGGPMPVAWGLAPMNVSEKTIARHLIPTLPGGGYLLADSQYDANPLYDMAAEAGFQLVARKTKDRGCGGLGHRRQSAGRLRSMEILATAFGRGLWNQRNAIERYFGAWVSTGGGLATLPAWVRHFGRVRNWVQTKILIAGARWLFLREPNKLAHA
jgi:transposase